MIKYLRELKHEIFLIKKNSRLMFGRCVESSLKKYSRKKGYEYSPGRYEMLLDEKGLVKAPSSSTFPVDHLRLSSDLPTAEGRAAPRKLYLFWTGENEITQNRAKSVEYLRSNNQDIDIIIVTNDNLSDFIVPGYPLHERYYDLSYVHRSDYLRAYFMYHHGGAYLDIKPFSGRISEMINRLNLDSSIWGVGDPDAYGAGVLPAGGRLAVDAKIHYSRTLSQFCFAFRPKTPFAAEWLTEVERRLDYFSVDLKRFPAQGPLGVENPNYPIPWFSILSAVIRPLSLKYSGKIVIDNFIRGDLGDVDSYR